MEERDNILDNVYTIKSNHDLNLNEIENSPKIKELKNRSNLKKNSIPFDKKKSKESIRNPKENNFLKNQKKNSLKFIPSNPPLNPNDEKNENKAEKFSYKLRIKEIFDDMINYEFGHEVGTISIFMKKILSKIK